MHFLVSVIDIIRQSAFPFNEQTLQKQTERRDYRLSVWPSLDHMSIMVLLTRDTGIRPPFQGTLSFRGSSYINSVNERDIHQASLSICIGQQSPDDQDRKGAKVPFQELINEGYEISENQILANVSADKIDMVMAHIICAREELV